MIAVAETLYNLANTKVVTLATIPYQIDPTDGSVTYIRYENQASTYIRKITVDAVTGIVTNEKANGLWANRASLTYREINAI